MIARSSPMIHPVKDVIHVRTEVNTVVTADNRSDIGVVGVIISLFLLSIKRFSLSIDRI